MQAGRQWADLQVARTTRFNSQRHRLYLYLIC